MRPARTVRRVVIGAIALAALGLPVSAHADPLGTPEVTSVSVRMVTPPRAFTGTLSAGNSSYNTVEFDLVATCTEVPTDVWQADYRDETVYVSTDGVADEDGTWDEPCGDPLADDDGMPIGATWEVESDTYTESYSVALGNSLSWRFAPIQVSFMDRVATVQLGYLRLKTFTRLVSHRYRSHYIVRAFADTNPDRYWNICVRQNAAIYSSGGRIYCNVRYSYWSYRWARAAYKAKVRWTVRGLDGFRAAVATRPPS